MYYISVLIYRPRNRLLIRMYNYLLIVLDSFLLNERGPYSDELRKGNERIVDRTPARPFDDRVKLRSPKASSSDIIYYT